jgi:hypothetical protein
MKKYRYLDMVKTLLPAEEYLEFEKRYTAPIKKSIKILNSRKDSLLIKERLQKDGRILQAPQFSFH